MNEVHLTAEELETYVLGGDCGGSPRASFRVEAHVLSCDECAVALGLAARWHCAFEEVARTDSPGPHIAWVARGSTFNGGPMRGSLARAASAGVAACVMAAMICLGVGRVSSGLHSGVQLRSEVSLSRIDCDDCDDDLTPVEGPRFASDRSADRRAGVRDAEGAGGGARPLSGHGGDALDGG